MQMDDDNITGKIFRHLHIFLIPKPIREVRHISHSLLSTVNTVNLIIIGVPSHCQHSAKCNLRFTEAFFLSDNLNKSRQIFSPTCSLSSSHFATEQFQQSSCSETMQPKPSIKLSYKPSVDSCVEISFSPPYPTSPQKSIS